MQQLSIHELDVHFEKMLRRFPQERASMFGRLAPQLEAAVRRSVGGGGKVASWQVAAEGRYGGYAAVHPKPKTFHEGYAVGHITNAITSGHKTSGGNGWVSGKHFYEDAVPQANAILDKEMREMEKRLKEAVEG